MKRLFENIHKVYVEECEGGKDSFRLYIIKSEDAGMVSQMFTSPELRRALDSVLEAVPD